MQPITRLTIATSGIWIAFLAASASQPSRLAGTAEHSELSQTRTPRHVALLIGINDYKALGREPDAVNRLTDLDGPRSDVSRMRVSLRQWGFTDSNDVRTIFDADGSRDGIARAFRWIRERATDPNDVVLVYFSGHGTSVPDAGGDEGDGKDEALVPYDAVNFARPADVVTDDSLGVWLGRLGTSNVTIVIDACYSGSITRGTPPGRPRGTPGAANIRDGVLDRSASSTHTVITASRSFETAQEVPFPRGSDNWSGVLTYHLTRILDGASATRGLRYDDLMTALRQAVAGEGVSQVPTIEGDSASPLFRSSVGVSARPFVTVDRQTGNRVTLGAGAIHGVRASAIYDVYGRDETKFAGSHLARVRVESVAETTALGRIIDENGDTVATPTVLPTLARAVASLVPLGGSDVPRLKLFVDNTARADWTRVQNTVDASRIEIVRDSTSSHARLTRARGVLEVVADGAELPPQLDGKTIPPLVVTKGDTIMGYSDATLCGVLRRAFTIAKLAELNNPTAPAELRVYTRVVKSGTRPPFDTLAVVDTAMLGTEKDTAKVDIYAYVSVPEQAVAGTRLFLSAAVAGFSSDPVVFYPRAQQPARFPLNRWVALWSGVPLTPPAGRESIKVTVNSDQYDLRSLVNSANLCLVEQSKGVSRGFGDSAERITGWAAVSHSLFILPNRR